MKKYKIIDAHCHIYPDKIAEKASESTGNFYGIQMCLDGKISTLLEHGQIAGIDHFIVQSVATTPKQVSSINNFIANAVAESGGKFTGLGTLHPDSEDIEGDMEHLLSLGLKGVKLHPDIQNFKIDDYRNLKIYELCEKHGIPILMHTGDSRYDRSNPNRLCPILEIYTDLIIVAAHFGGYSIWEEATDKLKDFPNVYVDCSSSFAFIKPRTAKKIIRTYGADKVLFATDYPMWEPKAEIEYFFKLKLKDEELEKILYKNAEKVFGI